MCVDEMSCRKGVWKFDALWEHPLGKGEATCHSSWLYSLMHRRYVEGYCKSSSRHGRLVENTLLIAEGILYVTNLYHNILLVFGLIISDIRMMSLIRSILIVVY